MNPGVKGGTLARGTARVSPPTCKHILACILHARCPELFGVDADGKFIVSKEELAGWCAGWGGLVVICGIPGMVLRWLQQLPRGSKDSLSKCVIFIVHQFALTCLCPGKRCMRSRRATNGDGTCSGALKIAGRLHDGHQWAALQHDCLCT
jgi:hypothetical protein